MSLNRLTAKEVGAITKPGLHADGGNLYLKVSETGAKSFGFRWRALDEDTGTSKLKYVSIGPAKDITLANARIKAGEYRRILNEGGDPAAEREVQRAEVRKASMQAAQEAQRAAQSVTFKDAAGRYLEQHLPTLKNQKAAEQWRTTLESYAFPKIGNMDVEHIKPTDIAEILRPIWRTKPETASRVRGRIEKVIAFANAEAQRYVLNPAALKNNLEFLLPRADKKVKHHAALDYNALPDLMARLPFETALSALALRLLILTTLRTSEIINLRWSEIDLEGSMITLPADRMKAGLEHVVPLSRQARAVLDQLAEHRLQSEAAKDLVFPGERHGKPLSNMAMLNLLKRLDAGVTAHGFRATFKSWASEETDFATDVIEAQLAHVPSKLEQAYRRTSFLQKRAALVQAWADHATSKTKATDAQPDKKRKAPRVRMAQAIDAIRQNKKV